MRLLVLGADGQLGGELVAQAARHGVRAAGTTIDDLDITDRGAVRARLRREHPDTVINCAAWTAVDAAEEHAAEARRINVDGASIVAQACAAESVRLCHVSTDYVFDGGATAPIPEGAEPRPLSVYGRTKLDGELAVRAAAPQALVVRTSWLYGRRGPNFVLTMLRLIDAGETVRVVADQHGSPTWTGHLAPALLRLLGSAAGPGTYHITNSGATTWHGFASAIAARSGAAVPVVPLRSGDFPTRARRPAYTVLDNAAWRALGWEPLPPWEEGLRAYLVELGRLAPAAPGGAAGSSLRA